MDFLLAAVAAAFQPAAPAAVEVHEDVLIESVSDDPGVASGIISTAIRIAGTRNGKTENYFIFFHRSGQPRPAIGATCSIAFARFRFQVDFLGQPNSAIGGREVRRFRCDGGEEVDAHR